MRKLDYLALVFNNHSFCERANCDNSSITTTFALDSLNPPDLLPIIGKATESYLRRVPRCHRLPYRLTCLANKDYANRGRAQAVAGLRESWRSIARRAFIRPLSGQSPTGLPRYDLRESRPGLHVVAPALHSEQYRRNTTCHLSRNSEPIESAGPT